MQTKKTSNLSLDITKDSLGYYSTVLSDERKNPKQKKIVVKKALSYLEGIENSPEKREALLFIITFQVLNQEYYRFDYVYKSLLENSILSKDSLNIANAYRFKASYLKNNTVFDSAFYFYGKSEKIYSKINDLENLGNVLLNKSVTQYFANDFLKADLTAVKAYNILKNQDDKYKIYLIR